MIYLAYAKTGHEFEVEQDLTAIGVDAWCPPRLEFVRRGKQRRPKPVKSPYLQNYLFVEIPVERFCEVSRVKYLARTLTPLSRADVKSLGHFRARVMSEFNEADRIKGNQAAICQFKAGQALEIIEGAFSDTLATFKRTVERARDLHPHVVAEIEMMGRAVEVEVDPLDVRLAR